ncbi:MAG: FAD-dependent oxidoreductase [Candidatus Brocadiaceae bacterium]|nr:FAD-dependent oxidoreductase [Candidatus Brocadiaceae bacterium]
MADQRRDVVIIGAGPAGLGASVYTGRALLRTAILESRLVGGQIIEAYDVDNYPGFPEGIAGAELIDRMVAQAQKFDVEVVNSGAEDVSVEDGGLKRVHVSGGDYVAPIVMVASGAYHRRLEVPGERKLSGRGVSYCATCDGPFFRDRKVVVVGGGDAALTEGVFLTRFASSVTLIHRRQGFRGRPAHLAEAQENQKMEFVLDTVVTEVLGEERVEGVRVRNVRSDQEWMLECDGVFVFIGHDPNTGYLKGVLPEQAGGLIEVDANMETGIRGLYAIGDVRRGSYRQVGTAIGEGITAAMHAEQRIKDFSH